ncbi:collagen-like triple helix repeat-containing protein [Thalassobius vesicularis]|uniref:collagen-like triple helix repeat-containing protein n=1 Tax=Thalassobius vesicularis TaxID=1294297 RepID=UPI001B3B2016|nr:collagen-like protein [Thalassobius vesicularis]
MSFKEHIPIIKDLGTLGIAVVSLVMSGTSLRQTNELSVADYAERIRENETRLKYVETGQSSATTKLDALTSRVASQTTVGDVELLRSKISQLEAELARVAELKTSGGAGPSAEQVASVLANRYSEVLRGPDGPQGPQGPKGEAGPAGPQGPAGAAGTGGATALPASDPAVRAGLVFTSDFPARQVGDMKIELVKCNNGGSSVSCEFQMTSSREELGDWMPKAYNSYVALENSKWLEGDRVTILGVSDNAVRHTFIKDIPVRVTMNFVSKGSISGSGLAHVKFCSGDNCRTKAEWSNVAFAS